MTLFDNFEPNRTGGEVLPGAWHVPDWLSIEQQRSIVEHFYEWSTGPVPLHHPKVRGHEMSVQTIGLGWHWSPYKYTRNAVDVNGKQVLPIPDWLVELGRRAVAETIGLSNGRSFQSDTALINLYDDNAKMGMHQDKDELSMDPVVSLSIGNSCQFRFGNTENRNRPYKDFELLSGDLFVFGGPARMAFHGVTKIYPGSSPDGCGLKSGRLNITMRNTGLTG